MKNDLSRRFVWAAAFLPGAMLDSPSDAVTIAIQFSKLPDRTNHVSTMNVDGVSKKLVVAVQNSNYQKL